MGESRPFIEFLRDVARAIRKLVRTLAAPSISESGPITVSFRQVTQEVNMAKVLRFIPVVAVPSAPEPLDVVARTLTVARPDGTAGDPLAIPAIGITGLKLSNDYAFAVGAVVGYELRSMDAGGNVGLFGGTFTVTDTVSPVEANGITVGFDQVVLDTPDAPPSE